VSVDLIASRAAFIAAIRSGDEPAARSVVEQLRSANVSPSSIYYDVFAPCMVTIGDLWERNELSVADEHLATAITERLIGQLSPTFTQRASQPDRGNVVLGCVAEERHVLGLRMLADLFRQQGWRVLYLGADVPNADFVRLAVRVSADIIAISASTQRHIPAVRELISGLRAALPEVGIIVGGAVFLNDPEIWREVGATLYHPNPQTAIQLATAQYGQSAIK
jgi:methanogenic corrinoid protein MtbC1